MSTSLRRTPKVYEEEPGNTTNIRALVEYDLLQREKIGTKKYGGPLRPHNGRDALKDAYEEALDLSMYLRQALYERDGDFPTLPVPAGELSPEQRVAWRKKYKGLDPVEWHYYKGGCMRNSCKLSGCA